MALRMNGNEESQGLFSGMRSYLPIESGNYPYVVARVKARKRFLFASETYARMLKMGVSEILRLIQEGDYRKEVNELAQRYAGVELLERATRTNLARVYQKIIGFSEGDLRQMLEAYSSKWDLWNVKTVLRGKFYGATAETIYGELVPAGACSPDFLRKLSQADGLPAVVDLLEDTVYGKPLEPLLEKKPEELKDLSRYEDTLSQVYYAYLLEAAAGGSEGTLIFRSFLHREIEVRNLLTLLRVCGGKVAVDWELFLPGGTELTVEELKRLSQLDILGISRELKGYAFSEILQAHLGEVVQRGLNPVTRALEKWYLAEATRHSHEYPLSVLPVLDYMVRKETETDNLRIIGRGKVDGLSEETIKELLVI